MKGSKIDCINPPGHPPQLLHRAALCSLAVSYVQYGGERGERGEGQVWREGGREGGVEGGVREGGREGGRVREWRDGGGKEWKREEGEGDRGE